MSSDDYKSSIYPDANVMPQPYQQPYQQSQPQPQPQPQQAYNRKCHRDYYCTKKQIVLTRFSENVQSSK